MSSPNYRETKREIREWFAGHDPDKMEAEDRIEYGKIVLEFTVVAIIKVVRYMTQAKYDRAMSLMSEIRQVEQKKCDLEEFMEEEYRDIHGELVLSDDKIIPLTEKDLVSLEDHWETEEEALEKQFDEL